MSEIMTNDQLAVAVVFFAGVITFIAIMGLFRVMNVHARLRKIERTELVTLRDIFSLKDSEGNYYWRYDFTKRAGSAIPCEHTNYSPDRCDGMGVRCWGCGYYASAKLSKSDRLWVQDMADVVKTENWAFCPRHIDCEAINFLTTGCIACAALNSPA